MTDTSRFGTRLPPSLPVPDDILRPPRPIDPLLAPPPPVGVLRTPGGRLLSEYQESPEPVYPVCPTVPEAPSSSWTRETVEPLPAGTTTGPGPRTEWTDEEDRTVVRILTSDTPPSSAAEVAAEYTRDTGKARSAGAWVTHLSELIARARLVIHPDVLPQFRILAAQEVGAPTPRTVGAPAAETKTRCRWHTWEDEAVRLATSSSTTAEAFLAVLAEKGSKRTPEGYVHRLSRLGHARTTPEEERAGLLHMATLLRPLVRAEAKVRAAEVPVAETVASGLSSAFDGDPDGAAFVAGATDTVRAELARSLAEEESARIAAGDTAALARVNAREDAQMREDLRTSTERATVPAPGPHPDLWRMEQVRRIRALVQAGILTAPEGDTALDRALTALPPV